VPHHGGGKQEKVPGCVIDSCSRIAWAEVVEDITALTVMFAALRCLNILAERYQDTLPGDPHGQRSGGRNRDSKKKHGHPFERMLEELGIKHRYTRPYRPQTNGKVERFWRSLEEDLLQEATFDSLEHLKDELLQYLVYYNHYRPHQGLGGKSPAEFLDFCPRIT
jgi:transposase InsO family protein